MPADGSVGRQRRPWPTAQLALGIGSVGGLLHGDAALTHHCITRDCHQAPASASNREAGVARAERDGQSGINPAELPRLELSWPFRIVVVKGAVRPSDSTNAWLSAEAVMAVAGHQVGAGVMYVSSLQPKGGT